MPFDGNDTGTREDPGAPAHQAEPTQPTHELLRRRAPSHPHYTRDGTSLEPIRTPASLGATEHWLGRLRLQVFLANRDNYGGTNRRDRRDDYDLVVIELCAEWTFW